MTPEADARLAAARAAYAQALVAMELAAYELAEATAHARQPIIPPIELERDSAVLLNVKEAAKAMSISPALLYEMLRRHELPAVYVGLGRSAVRVRRDDLLAWAAAHASREGRAA